MADSDSDGFGERVPGSPCHSSLSRLSAPSTAHEVPPVAKASPPSLPGFGKAAADSYFDNVALIASRSRLLPRLPWEQGYAALVLGSSQSVTWPFGPPPLHQAYLQDCAAAASASSLVAFQMPRPMTVSATAHRKVKFLSTIKSDDALRQRAIMKWRMLIEADLEATTVGMQILQMIEALAPDEEVLENLANVFQPKATATLAKRVASMLHFLSWARGRAVFRPLLAEEPVVYAYVSQLYKDRVAATVASSFRQALVFYRHLLGCQSAEAAITSTRISGCCIRQLITKRPLQQATELTVDQLRILENLTMHAPSLPDRVAAGYFTFLALSSSRFGDAMHASTLTVEVDADNSMCIELGTNRHKTATTAAKRTQFLPLLAFSPGLLREGIGWGKAWLQAREDCKLVIGPGHPVLPASGSDGKFLKRAVTSGEGSAWLMELLVMGGDSSGSKRTTHSLKATLLSWAAKYGMTLDFRRLLGHHSHPTLKSILTYSRDALAEPLAQVWQMLTDIINNVFNPEAPRIRRIIGNTGQLHKKQRTETSSASACIPEPLPVRNFSDVQLDDDLPDFDDDSIDHEPQHVDADCEQDPGAGDVTDSEDSNSSDSSSSNLSEDDLPDPALDDIFLEASGIAAREFAVIVPEFTAFQHNVSGIVHYRHDLEVHKLECSRLLTGAYTKITSVMKFEWPKCKGCAASMSK